MLLLIVLTHEKRSAPRGGHYVYVTRVSKAMRTNVSVSELTKRPITWVRGDDERLRTVLNH